MLPQRSAAYETAPLTELLAVLLRQFKRPLKSRGVDLADADAEQVALAITTRAPLNPSALALRAALLALVAESEGVLARWQLTFEQALDTPMDAIPDWENTAEFLEVANIKSNAELRISTGSLLLVALGDPSRLAHVRFLATRPTDLDSVLAQRILAFTAND